MDKERLRIAICDDKKEDIANVVTWFTLLMLYWDKRREWSKNKRNQ